MRQSDNPAAAYLRPFDIDVELTRTAPEALTLKWSDKASGVDVLLQGERLPRRIRAGRQWTFPASVGGPQAPIRVRFIGGPLDGRDRLVAERIVPLESAKNFRDLGGYPAAGGRFVRWGRVYRAEALSGLTPRDLALLEGGLGLKLVCDLRGASERSVAPDRAGRIPALSLPIEPGPPSALLSGKPDLGASYIQWIEEKGESVFGPLLARLADPNDLPTVFHCTAGKDRTGVASALLLGLLGVSKKNIVADYALTNLSYPALLESLKANPAYAPMIDRLRPLLIANPDWIEAMLGHIENRYGSVEGYAARKMKLTSLQIGLIRTNLLAKT